MSLDVHITDPSSDRKANVNNHGRLEVAVALPDVPIAGTVNQYRYLTGYLGRTGLTDNLGILFGGMNVDGSATAIDYYVKSEMEYDINIMGISILLADDLVTHERFGNIAALANGWDLKFFEEGEDTYVINGAETGGQIIAQAGLAKPYGADDNTFQLSNWAAAVDAQTIWIPVAEYIPGGFRIGRGTQSRIIATVNDDLTGLELFYVRIFGYKHYPTGNEQ